MEYYIHTFPYYLTPVQSTKLKSSTVGSISITSTWKILARDHYFESHVSQVAPASVIDMERPTRNMQSLPPRAVNFVSKLLVHANVQDNIEPRPTYLNPLLVRDSRCSSVASGSDGRPRTKEAVNISTAVAAQICQEHQSI
jgi:hypothetical protein